jgi:hypothetical protein
MILSRSIAGPEQRETTKPYTKTGLLDRPDRAIAMGVRERGAGLPGQHSAPVRPDADTFPAQHDGDADYFAADAAVRGALWLCQPAGAVAAVARRASAMPTAGSGERKFTGAEK